MLAHTAEEERGPKGESPNVQGLLSGSLGAGPTLFLPTSLSLQLSLLIK